ncbi:prephenate dehydrogenase/arogenate dehydrogenase family protein [Candidatus Micrarchaeota archaeon]|nr:prephenate dehydrogenase/arogenate dehydrogenase family protein [Candidatus Micrarchaeota archaeon]
MSRWHRISIMRVAIIGGAGDFGALYAQLLKEDGFDVTITSRSEERGRKKAKELGVESAREEEACANSEVVIVSVSIRATAETIKRILPFLKKECLLMDFTSIKTLAVNEMKKAKCEEIVGCHPMHGPRITSLEGQTIVFTPVRKGERFAKIKHFFEKRKARVLETTADEHDEAMAVVQALTHFTYLSAAGTIKALGVDLKRSRVFASSLYELTMDFVARIIGQNPQLYAEIQMFNPKAKRVRDEFVKQARELKKIIDEKNEDAFIKFMNEAAKHYGNLEEGMAKSDKAIAALNEEVRRLKAATGKKIAVENIYSHVVHFGELAELDAENITLKTKSKTQKLKTSNVKLLGWSELREWKKKNSVKRDYSFVFSKCEPETVKNAGEGIDEDVVSVEKIDVYEMGEKGTSVTLRFTIFAEANLKEIDGKIKKRFEGLGAKIR